VWGLCGKFPRQETFLMDTPFATALLFGLYACRSVGLPIRFGAARFVAPAKYFFLSAKKRLTKFKKLYILLTWLKPIYFI
jgi:hypothetical protein